MAAVSTRRGCQLRAVAGPWLDALPFSRAGPFAFPVQPVRFLSRPVLAQERSAGCDGEVWERAQEDIRVPGGEWGPPPGLSKRPVPSWLGVSFLRSLDSRSAGMRHVVLQPGGHAVLSAMIARVYEAPPLHGHLTRCSICVR